MAASSSSSSSPRFFRVILHRNLEDQKLTIPKKFVKDNGKSLSSSVRLKLPDGMEWKVGLTTAANGVVWLQKDWHKFAEHYSLEVGSMLVFKFDGKLTFDTTIFDPTGVETEYSCNFNDSEGGFQEEEEASDESQETSPRRSMKRKKTSVPCRQSHKKMRNEDSFSVKTEPEEEEGFNNCRDMPRCKKTMPKQEIGDSRKRQQSAIKAEENQNFSSKSGKPGFKLVMNQSNVGGRFNLIIPKGFAGKHFPDMYGVIKLQTSNGRNWPLLYKWCLSRGRYVYISSGWKEFVKENHLKVGDVGLFQFIKKDEFSFTKLQGASPSLSPSPMKRSATTRNPFFEVVILFKSYRNSVLNIPLQFAKEHLSHKMQTAKLQLGNKQWNVTVKQYESCVRFSAGWSSFYGDNDLEDGDTCFFEMVNKKNCVFDVTILRKVTSSASMD